MVDLNPNITPTASLLEIVYTSLAIIGLATMVYATVDNRRDLGSLRSRGINSFAELTASIGIWDAVAAGLFHLLFLVLGGFALAAPPPHPDKKTLSDLFSLGFIFMQCVIVGVQLRNQLARRRIRRKLRRSRRPED